MQRNKSSSVEVKQVIGALCRLLTAAGLDAVPAPETFRRAKFAGRGEEDPFWQLLSSILLAAGVVTPEVNTGLRGDCRKLVAVGMWQTGYHADWMRKEEGGEEGAVGEEGEGATSRSFSSRDLLLALGWLLAAGTLEKLVTQRVQKLDTTLLVSLPRDPHPSSQLQFDSACLRRLHWLTGNLRHQGRTLLAMLRERTGALHAVLSVNIPSAGASSEVLKQDCVCIRQLCDLLEAYLTWKQVEAVFWTWMDSVMDFHLTESVGKKPTGTFDVSPRVCHHQNRGLEKLEDMLLRLHTAQEEHGSDRGAVGGRNAGDCSLPHLSSCLLDLSALTRVCRARLQTERPVRRPAEGPPGSAQTPDHLPVHQAAGMLRHLEAQLLESRDRQRLANKEQLQEMIGRLDELVLIPP